MQMKSKLYHRWKHLVNGDSVSHLNSYLITVELFAVPGYPASSVVSSWVGVQLPDFSEGCPEQGPKRKAFAESGKLYPSPRVRVSDANPTLVVKQLTSYSVLQKHWRGYECLPVQSGYICGFANEQGQDEELTNAWPAWTTTPLYQKQWVELICTCYQDICSEWAKWH